MATVIVGAVLFLVGLGIMKNGAVSIWGYLHGEILPEPGILALIAALVSIVLKELLFRYTAVEASDAFSSIGTAAGIGGAILLGENWRVLDPVAAVIISVLIIRVSVKLIVPGLEELMEKSLPEKDEKKILEIILSFPEVRDPHHLRTRRIGNYCAVDVHVRMDKDMPLGDVHDITESIESRLKEELGEKTIINIHAEPLRVR